MGKVGNPGVHLEWSGKERPLRLFFFGCVLDEGNGFGTPAGKQSSAEIFR